MSMLVGQCVGPPPWSKLKFHTKNLLDGLELNVVGYRPQRMNSNDFGDLEVTFPISLSYTLTGMLT